MALQTSQLVLRDVANNTSNTADADIFSHESPDGNTSAYNGQVTVNGEDSKGIVYSAVFDIEFSSVLDSAGNFVEQSENISFAGTSETFNEHSVRVTEDGVNSVLKIANPPALSPKRTEGSDTQFFATRLRTTAVVDGSYEAHILGAQNADGNLGHQFYSSGTRNTEQVSTATVNGANQAVGAAFDSAGDLHVAWIDDTPQLNYAVKSGGTWSVTTGIATASAGTSNWGVSVDIDENDIPHVAWNNNEDVRHADKEGGSWSDETTGGVAIKDADSGADMVVDSSSNIGIVHQNKSNEVVLTRWDGSSWTSTVMDSRDPVSPQLAFNGTNWGAIYTEVTSQDLNVVTGNPADGFTTDTVDSSKNYAGAHRTAALSWTGSNWLLLSVLADGEADEGKTQVWLGDISGGWTDQHIHAVVNDQSGTASDDVNVEKSDKFIVSYVGESGGKERYYNFETSDQGVTYKAVSELKITTG